MNGWFQLLNRFPPYRIKLVWINIHQFSVANCRGDMFCIWEKYNNPKDIMSWHLEERVIRYERLELYSVGSDLGNVKGDSIFVLAHVLIYLEELEFRYGGNVPFNQVCKGLSTTTTFKLNFQKCRGTWSPIRRTHPVGSRLCRFVQLVFLKKLVLIFSDVLRSSGTWNRIRRARPKRSLLWGFSKMISPKTGEIFFQMWSADWILRNVKSDTEDKSISTLWWNVKADANASLKALLGCFKVSEHALWILNSNDVCLSDLIRYGGNQTNMQVDTRQTKTFANQVSS